MSMWYFPLPQSEAGGTSLVFIEDMKVRMCERKVSELHLGGERTALRTVIFIPNVFLQIWKIDDFTAGKLASCTGEGERIAVGSDT